MEKKGEEGNKKGRIVVKKIRDRISFGLEQVFYDLKFFLPTPTSLLYTESLTVGPMYSGNILVPHDTRSSFRK